MKRIFTVLAAVLLTASVFAQTPEKMSYQAVIRNTGGALVTSTQIGMEINIRQGSETGTVVYTETQTPTTNANGLVSIEIGGGAGFNSINWASDNFYIETKTAVVAPLTTYTITGVSQLLSVPYALHAKTAESIAGGIIETDPVFNAWNKDYADLTNTPTIPTVPANVGAFTNDAGYLTEFNETDPQFNAWNKSTGIVISESQITDLQSYLTSETDPSVTANFDFTDAATGDLLQFNGTKWVKVTPDYISDYTVIEADVTAHEAALTVSESQISDLGNYIETETQTISDVAALDNSVNTQLKNVTNPTEAQDAATKAYVDALLERIEALEEPDILNNGFTDSRDGTHYEAVTIGNQIWMAENLKYLPSVIGPSTSSVTTAYYYVYGYDGTNVTTAKATANYNTYGVLYNWPAAMAGSESSSSKPSGVQGVCPTGWHLPSDAEWSELTNYLGGANVAAGKLKETGTTHWSSSNNVTNTTGFTALPAGYRKYDGTFDNVGIVGYWWTTTLYSANNPRDWSMAHFSNSVAREYNAKDRGFSVRCVRIKRN